MAVRLLSCVILGLVSWGWSTTAVAVDSIVQLEQHDKGVKATINGKPFTEYLLLSKTKPILWPIIGPTGQAMTRSWPLGEAPTEKRDHPHHRSFWFTHGDVNGVDFWMEEATPTKKPGTTVHQSFELVRSGTATEPARLVTKNLWQDPNGKTVCSDTRELTFGGDDAARWIDFKITLHADHGPVTFGDTKEGSFGVRVAETAKVEAKLGGKIVTSEGKTDDAAWGTRAAWVDYHGPVGEKKERLGVAILNHPESFRHPTHWHVRTYGLFAANPFGLHDFEKQPAGSGKHILAAGESLVLRYRVILHQGDEKEGKIAERYAAFAKEK